MWPLGVARWIAYIGGCGGGLAWWLVVPDRCMVMVVMEVEVVCVRVGGCDNALVAAQVA